MPQSSIVVRPEPEGSPSYSASKRLQAAGLRSAVALFERVAEVVPLPKPPYPVVLADYGAATGHNSLLPVGAAIEVLGRRIRKDQSILVTHTDIPENDFTVLFQTLENDPDSYLRRDVAAFAAAVGRSFYTQILPSNSVTLAWSAWAIHWLSQAPAAADHLLPALSSDPAVRSACVRQAAADWHEFIAFRGRELTPEGRLVVLTMGRDESGEFGMRPLMDAAHDTLRELEGDALITADERASMRIPITGRSDADLVAPFAPKDRFEGLSVEHVEVFEAEDRFWQQFQVDQDARAFGAAWAGFLRAVAFDCVAAGLTGGPADPRAAEVATRWQKGIADKLTAAPQRMRILLATAVLVKNR